MTALALTARALAIAIAILGVWDPAITSMREGAPDVAVIGDSREIHRRLDEKFNVVDGPWDHAAATIVVGNSLPDRFPSGKVFAVRDTTVAVERFDVPAEVTSEARIPIRITSSSAQTELRANGAVVDLSSRAQARDLLFAPWSPSLMTLEARAITGRDTASAFAITRVVDRAHAVLFFDRRPSYMSTFVRRALEADRRFSVASRVVTSRNVSTSAGQPPSSLSDPSLLELYDVVVVGTPTLLTQSDVSGLDQFLRRRGGAVVLLYDGGPVKGPHDQLSGVTEWFTRTNPRPLTARAEGDSSALRFVEVSLPQRFTGIHRTIASTIIDDYWPEVVWSTGVGAGQVIVSGALDSWKYRDRSTSAFDDFWRTTISRAAREASAPVTIEATPNLARPGEKITVRVTSRDTLVQPQVQLDSTNVPVWYGERRGEFVGTVRAPAEGEHLLTVTAGPARNDAPIVVRKGVVRAHPNEWSSLALAARATGGVAGSLDSVVGAANNTVKREKRPERWWPMRSAWWVVPFSLLLGFEWLARRRRGLS